MHNVLYCRECILGDCQHKIVFFQNLKSGLSWLRSISQIQWSHRLDLSRGGRQLSVRSSARVDHSNTTQIPFLIIFIILSRQWRFYFHIFPPGEYRCHRNQLPSRMLIALWYLNIYRFPFFPLFLFAFLLEILGSGTSVYFSTSNNYNLKVTAKFA